MDLEWKKYGENHEGTKYRRIGTVYEIFRRILLEKNADGIDKIKSIDFFEVKNNNNPLNTIFLFSCQAIEIKIICSQPLSELITKNPTVKNYLEFFSVGTYKRLGQKQPEARLFSNFGLPPNAPSYVNDRFNKLMEIILPDGIDPKESFTQKYYPPKRDDLPF